MADEAEISLKNDNSHGNSKESGGIGQSRKYSRPDKVNNADDLLEDFKERSNCCGQSCNVTSKPITNTFTLFLIYLFGFCL